MSTTIIKEDITNVNRVHSAGTLCPSVLQVRLTTLTYHQNWRYYQNTNNILYIFSFFQFICGSNSSSIALCWRQCSHPQNSSKIDICVTSALSLNEVMPPSLHGITCINQPDWLCVCHRTRRGRTSSTETPPTSAPSSTTCGTENWSTTRSWRRKVWLHLLIQILHTFTLQCPDTLIFSAD